MRRIENKNIQALIAKIDAAEAKGDSKLADTLRRHLVELVRESKFNCNR